MSDAFERIKSRLHHKAELVHAFMNSETGKALIEVLEDEFYDGELFDPDPCVTAYNLGRRDVVNYLKQLERLKENGI